MNIPKSLISFMFLVFGMFISSTAFAQRGNWYTSNGVCQEAYWGGGVYPYIPGHLPQQANRRAMEVGVNSAPLQNPVCVQMLVADGQYHSVFLVSGTPMLWKNGKPYAHAACGNLIKGEVLWLKPQQPYVEQPQPAQNVTSQYIPPSAGGTTVNVYYPGFEGNATTVNQSTEEFPSFYQRNKGWIKPVAWIVGGAAVGYCVKKKCYRSNSGRRQNNDQWPARRRPGEPIFDRGRAGDSNLNRGGAGEPIFGD